jgi:hypothetical protein
LEGFASELIGGIGHDGLIHEFREKVQAWLSSRHGWRIPDRSKA